MYVNTLCTPWGFLFAMLAFVLFIDTNFENSTLTDDRVVFEITATA